MEEILRKLQKEASGSKHRAIKESCTWAIGKGREELSGAGQEAPMERFCNGGGRETSTNLLCAGRRAPLSGGEGSGAPGPFRTPGSPALLEGPGTCCPSRGAPASPGSRRLDLPPASCEAHTPVSVAVTFRLCSLGAVFSFKGPLPPLNHRKKHVEHLLRWFMFGNLFQS